MCGVIFSYVCTNIITYILYLFPFIYTNNYLYEERKQFTNLHIN